MGEPVVGEGGEVGECAWVGSQEPVYLCERRTWYGVFVFDWVEEDLKGGEGRLLV